MQRGGDATHDLFLKKKGDGWLRRIDVLLASLLLRWPASEFSPRVTAPALAAFCG